MTLYRKTGTRPSRGAKRRSQSRGGDVANTATTRIPATTARSAGGFVTACSSPVAAAGQGV